MRNLYFLIFSLIGLSIFYEPLKQLVGLSFSDPLYSHFLLIPVVSLYILAKIRLRVFAQTGYAVLLGVTVVAAGLLLYWIGLRNAGSLNQNDYLSLMMLSFLVCLIGGFIGVYGTLAFRQALFPLLFLIFIIPVPTVILEPLIKVLLIGSAETSYKVFQILDIPVYRQDFVFELPGISVEVARQCSGIRSTLALIITSVLAGYLFLETGWRRIVLCICVFPITVLIRVRKYIALNLFFSLEWIRLL